MSESNWGNGVDPSLGPARWSVRKATQHAVDFDATALMLDGCTYAEGPTVRDAIAFLEALADALLATPSDGEATVYPPVFDDMHIAAGSESAVLAVLAWHRVWLDTPNPWSVGDAGLCLEAAAKLRDGWHPPQRLVWLGR